MAQANVLGVKGHGYCAAFVECGARRNHTPFESKEGVWLCDEIERVKDRFYKTSSEISSRGTIKSSEIFH